MFRLTLIAVLFVGTTNARSTVDREQWQTTAKPEWWWEDSTIVRNHTTPQWWDSVTTAPSWWQSIADMSTKLTTADMTWSWPTTTSPPWWWQSTPRSRTPSHHTTDNENRRTSHGWTQWTSPRPATWWPQYSAQSTERFSTEHSYPITSEAWWAPTRGTTPPWFFSTGPPQHVSTNNEGERTSYSWTQWTSPRPATWWPQYSAQSTERFSTEQSYPTTSEAWWVPTRDTTPPWFFSTGPPQHANTAETMRPESSTTHRATTQRPVPTTASHVLKERQCACDPAKLYLDIVVVVDSSLSMTKDGLIEVAADLATIFQQTNVSSGTGVGQYVRVALVTFSNEAFIHGKLDEFTSYDSLVERLLEMPYLGGSELNIESALQRASDILQSSRYYAKTAILLYTSAYGEGGFIDPQAIANQIKESGTKIITVAFRQQPEGSLVEKLSHLASPGFSFASRQSIITDEILRALCQVNCYCKNNWIQYSDNLYSPRLRYGECIRAMDVDANWMAASFACKTMAPGAHLVNELTPHKNYFVYEYASHVLPRPYKYSIGLRFDPLTGNYAWQTANNTKVPSSQLYDEWNPGYPNRSKGECVSKIERNGWYNVGYQNVDCLHEPMRYVCQMPACDTENFCSSPDN